MSKLKVCVLGSTGMLGNAVGNYFNSNDKYTTFLSYRNEKYKYGKHTFKFDVFGDASSWQQIPPCDYIINCIGVIKPAMKTVPIMDSIYINSMFPHYLAEVCKHNNIKLINITTDCVYSGTTGYYMEDTLHDCLDDYGKTKSLGECPDKAMVIRTSIIGDEIHNNYSLIAWAKSMAGQTVNGFQNHFWNGVTTNEYAKICDTIIQNDLFETGLFHVFSDVVSKYEMMEAFNNKWNLGLTINPYVAVTECDRTLSTIKDLNGKLGVNSFARMIEEL
jgi:dTDP-4-dehydrorhamnose reductase